MKCSFTKIMLAFWSLLSFPIIAQAQSYFKKLQNPDQFYEQQIANFPNGDLLIGDSFLEAQRTGDDGKIFLTRIDRCGSIQWSYEYEWEDYMEVKDLKINELGDAFIYGSAYKGLDERIFLLKVNQEGEVQRFHLFQPETVDHFTYNIELKDAVLMAYGLLFDFGTKKQGFIAVFDHELNFKWAKKFSPFESNGNAIITNKNEFLCWSGNFIMKFDSEGQLIWGQTIENDIGAKLEAGPFELGDGYIFESIANGQAYLFKINEQAELLWSSNTFESSKYPLAWSLFTDNQSLISYTCPSDGFDRVCYQILRSDGSLENLHVFRTNEDIAPSKITQSIYQDDLIRLNVDADVFASNGLDIKEFILQFSLDDMEEDCAAWEEVNMPTNFEPNTILIPFDSLSTPTVLQKLENTTISRKETTFPLFGDVCGSESELSITKIDTFISCTEDWLIELPQGFQWEDNTRENPRKLMFSGKYRAKNNQNCNEVNIIEYELTKPVCDCEVYLPTAFSPNNDNINELLKFEANCSLSDFQMSVFDRWGNKIFESLDAGQAWDGNILQKKAPTGVYIVHVYYEWKDEKGISYSQNITQDINLFR